MMSTHPEQQANLKRVQSNIDRHVLHFCATIFALVPPRFYMHELTKYVESQVGIAPDSAGRILRSLRQRKLIDYDVINRRASHYELTAVKIPPAQ